jgi:hypothetical protein
MLLLLIRIVALSDKIGLTSLVGCLIYMAILSFRSFVTEDVLAGGSIALSLVLFLTGLQNLITDKLEFRQVSISGFWIGLACITRFDYAFASVYIALFILISQDVSIRRRLSLAAVYCAIVMMVLLPWLCYNFLHFGKPLASDNSRQVLAANPSFVLDYYADPPLTLFSNPKEWFWGLATKKCSRVVRGLWEVFTSTPVAIVFIMLLFFRSFRNSRNLPIQYNYFSRLCIPILLLTCVPVLLVGYGMIGRYYTLHILLLLFMCSAYFLVSVSQAWSYWRSLGILLLSCLLLLKMYSPAFIEQKINVFNPEPYMIANGTGDNMTQVSTILREVQGEYRILITDDLKAARYGAQSGLQVALKPILRGDFRKYVVDWKITHIYDPDGWHKTISLAGVSLRPMSEPGLYRIEVE